ncbi:MAG: hypothetical protein HQM12_22575 [SAR324 cluster bacterium]|nr:hypothetical protein [SAR324 cluster bacterium]
MAPTLKGKSVSFGEILDKKTSSKLRLSESIVAELSVAFKNQGIDIVLSEKQLSISEQKAFQSGLRSANALLTGSFQQWGNSVSLSVQVAETDSGNVLAGKTVRIALSDIPSEMWEPVSNDVGGETVSGQGTASISYQCLPEEKPCPPPTELKRRAVDAARMLAMEDLAQKSGVDLSALNTLANGRASKKTLETKTGGQLKKLKFSQAVFREDEVTLQVTGEVIPSR